MSRKNENRPAQPPSNRVSEAFDEALRLEGDARDSYLAGLAPALRAEVVSLLQALEGAGDFMEAPAANGVFAPQPHGTEFPPAQVGRYVLFEQLGAGGMAQVYRAKTRGPAGFEKQVAIKRIHPYFKSDPNFVEQFEREARLSSCLEHANIVQVYDFLHLDDAYYLVMEYIEGISLEALIERVTRARRRIELPLSVFITNEIAKGLDYAHSRRDGTTGRPLQIVHRDISPKNIMLSFSGSVKLVDFGIAKIRDGAVMTETGTLKGTPYYMAPEQAAGKIVDRRSDIFSAGVVLYEMLAGQRLFRQKGTLAIVEEVRRCAEVPARLQALQAPEPLKLILTKMLAHAPADRYQDAASLHADLQDYLARHFPRFTQTTLAQALGVAFESEIAKRQRLGAEIDRRIELKLRESARRSADTVRRRRRLSVAAAMLLLATFFGSTWTGMLPSREPAEQPTIEVEATPDDRASSSAKAQPSAAPEPAPPAAPIVETPPAPAPGAKPLRPNRARRAEPSRRAATEVPADSLPAGSCLARIDSKPAGARLSINGIVIGNTPVATVVQCHAPLDLQLERAGYRPLRRRIVVRDPDSGVLLSLLRENPEPENR